MAPYDAQMSCGESIHQAVTLPKGIRTPDPQIAASILIRQLPLMTATNAAKAGHNPLILLSGAPEGIRTPDLCLRRGMNIRFFNDLQVFLVGQRQRFRAVFGQVKPTAVRPGKVAARPGPSCLSRSSTYPSAASSAAARPMLRAFRRAIAGRDAHGSGPTSAPPSRRWR